MAVVCRRFISLVLNNIEPARLGVAFVPGAGTSRRPKHVFRGSFILCQRFMSVVCVLSIFILDKYFNGEYTVVTLTRKYLFVRRLGDAALRSLGLLFCWAWRKCAVADVEASRY